MNVLLVAGWILSVALAYILGHKRATKDALNIIRGNFERMKEENNG